MLDGNQGNLLDIFDQQTLSFNHTGLSLGQVWYYKIFVRNRGLYRSTPVSKTLTVEGVPEVPAQPRMLGGTYNPSITVQWQVPFANGQPVFNYRIEIWQYTQDTYSFDPQTNITNVSNTTFIIDLNGTENQKAGHPVCTTDSGSITCTTPSLPDWTVSNTTINRS